MNVTTFIGRYNTNTRYSVRITGLHPVIFNRITAKKYKIEK